MAGNSKAHTPKFPLKRLSDRVLEIFELIGHGKNPREIAENLHISARTVDAHRGHSREKLGLADSSDLTCYAIRWIESGNLE
jgi:DNA-binding NarL/FixJ family response regulator